MARRRAPVPRPQRAPAYDLLDLAQQRRASDRQPSRRGVPVLSSTTAFTCARRSSASGSRDEQARREPAASRQLLPQRAWPRTTHTGTSQPDTASAAGKARHGSTNSHALATSAAMTRMAARTQFAVRSAARATGGRTPAHARSSATTEASVEPETSLSATTRIGTARR